MKSDYLGKDLYENYWGMLPNFPYAIYIPYLSSLHEMVIQSKQFNPRTVPNIDFPELNIIGFYSFVYNDGSILPINIVICEELEIK
jgi:hypothetical protein